MSAPQNAGQNAKIDAAVDDSPPAPVSESAEDLSTEENSPAIEEETKKDAVATAASTSAADDKNQAAINTPRSGFLAMFSAPLPPAARALEGKEPLQAAPDTTSPFEDHPLQDNPEEEVSEAELTGETEADPEKIAVPEEPIDDGRSHDFITVYSVHPDQNTSNGELPGVEWEEGIVLASLGGREDPSRLFDGPLHPFARTVPGIPRQAIKAANGLLLAHGAISVDCIKPNLLNLVRRAENHFGKKVIVTSGYRSPAHNRRVRGARHSNHLYCNALDLYMPGVARDDLARYFFAQPDRGGLGLYCHTRSIHIDTGKRRQWRWGCRRRKG